MVRFSDIVKTWVKKTQTKTVTPCVKTADQDCKLRDQDFSYQEHDKTKSHGPKLSGLWKGTPVILAYHS